MLPAVPLMSIDAINEAEGDMEGDGADSAFSGRAAAPSRSHDILLASVAEGASNADSHMDADGAESVAEVTLERRGSADTNGAALQDGLSPPWVAPPDSPRDEELPTAGSASARSRSTSRAMSPEYETVRPGTDASTGPTNGSGAAAGPSHDDAAEDASDLLVAQGCDVDRAMQTAGHSLASAPDASMRTPSHDAQGGESVDKWTVGSKMLSGVTSTHKAGSPLLTDEEATNILGGQVRVCVLGGMQTIV